MFRKREVKEEDDEEEDVQQNKYRFLLSVAEVPQMYKQCFLT